jgi:hypothetical protein
MMLYHRDLLGIPVLLEIPGTPGIQVSPGTLEIPVLQGDIEEDVVITTGTTGAPGLLVLI